MTPTPEQRDAVAAAVKSAVTEIIEKKAGFFASTVEGDFGDAEVYHVADAAIAALTLPS